MLTTAAARTARRGTLTTTQREDIDDGEEEGVAGDDGREEGNGMAKAAAYCGAGFFRSAWGATVEAGRGGGGLTGGGRRGEKTHQVFGLVSYFLGVEISFKLFELCTV
jgi:hypothetical protein